MNTAKQQDMVASQPDDQTGSIISVIERAAKDPNIDVQKMEKLLDMQERILDKQAEHAFGRAMIEAQRKITPIATNAKNKQTNSKYTTYDALDHAVRPIYIDAGFSLSFGEGETKKEQHVRVMCYVTHEAGHTRTYYVDMPADGKGAKGGDVMTKTHAAGSAYTYGKRYLLKMIFNIAEGEQDDDGNAASTPRLTESQIADLEAKIQEVDADRGKFLRWAKVKDPSEIAQAALPSLIKALEAKAKNQ